MVSGETVPLLQQMQTIAVGWLCTAGCCFKVFYHMHTNEGTENLCGGGTELPQGGLGVVSAGQGPLCPASLPPCMLLSRSVG